MNTGNNPLYKRMKYDRILNKNMTASLLPVLNKRTLTEKVEQLVHRDHMRYAEAVVHVCDDHGIDPIDVAKLIDSSPLKAKIEAESIRLNVIKPRRRSTTATL